MAELLDVFIENIVIGGWTVLFLLGLGIVGYIIYYIRTYPIKVIVWERIGGQLRLAKPDRARILDKQGVKHLIGKSKIHKIDLQGITYDVMQQTSRGGYVLEVEKESIGQFKVLSRNHIGTITKLEHDVAWWNNLAKREVRDRYSTQGWKEFLPSIILGTAIVVLVVLVIISWDYYTENNKQTQATLVAALDRVYGTAPTAPAAPPPSQIIRQGGNNPNQPAPPEPLPFENTLNKVAG